MTNTVAQFWSNIQDCLFPYLEEVVGPLTEKQMQLIRVLEIIRIEEFVPDYRWYEGRPRKTRAAIARSFVAKMIYNIDSARALWERLLSDKNLRRICGWENPRGIPSESTQRVVNLYDLMDSAYDAPWILNHSRSLGHVSLVDANPRGDRTLSQELDEESRRQKLTNIESPKAIRYKNRTTAERANARLKDEFGVGQSVSEAALR